MKIFVKGYVSEDFSEGAYQTDGLTALGIFYYHLQGADVFLEDESGEWFLFLENIDDGPAMGFINPEQPLKQYLEALPQGKVDEELLNECRNIIKDMFGFKSVQSNDLYREIRQFVIGGMN